MHRDERVMATLGGVRSEESTAGQLQMVLDHWREHDWGWWILCDRETGGFVGRGGLRELQVGGCTEVEIGYALLAEHWGRGLATEMAAESARVGFLEVGHPDLVAFTVPTNRASQRVMEKVGFRYERDIVHADLPHVLYRLTVDQWRGREGPARLLSTRR